MKKKVLAAILVVCVVFGTGAAFAQPARRYNQELDNREDGRGHWNLQQANRPEFPPFFPGRFPDFDRKDPRIDFDFGRDHKCRCGFNGQEERGRMFGFGHKGPMFTPDMPKEIREKATDLAKLKIDLEEAMSDNPLNKAKAIEVHAKIQKLEAEIEAWRFEKALDMIEEVRKQHELNKTIPPAPKAPAEKTEAN